MTANVASLVKACGAEPFNHRFFSDHWGLYADLRLSGLFHRNLSPLASPKYRDIRSGNPTLIRKYITTLSARLAANGIPARAALLASNVDNYAAEQLDTEMTDTMLAACKVCAHTARLQISPNYTKARPGTKFSNRSSPNYAHIAICPTKLQNGKDNSPNI
jgi:hypothetical protein